MLTVNFLNEHLPQKEHFAYVQFEAWHLDKITNCGFDSLSNTDLLEEKQNIIEQARDDAAFTIMYKNKPVCIFGCLIYWSGVAEMWSFISDDIRKSPVFLTKCGRKWAEICDIAFKLHRLEITVNAADVRATKWAYALGFKHEALMEKYSAEHEDFNLFVRINHER